MKVLVLFGSGYRESGEGVDFGVNDLLLTADSSDVVLSEPSSVTERLWLLHSSVPIYFYCTRFREVDFGARQKGPYCRLRRAGGAKYLQLFDYNQDLPIKI